MLDKILYVIDESDMPLITAVCFITLHINWYNNQLLPLLSQFLLIPHRINKFMVP